MPIHSSNRSLKLKPFGRNRRLGAGGIDRTTTRLNQDCFTSQYHFFLASPLCNRFIYHSASESDDDSGCLSCLSCAAEQWCQPPG